MAKKARSAKQLANDRRLGRMAKARAHQKSTPKRRTTAKRSGVVKSVVSRRTGKPVSAAAWAQSGYRRNPIMKKKGLLGGIVGDTLIPAATAASGAIALDVAWGFLPIPANLKVGPMRHAVKGAGAIGLGMLAGMILPKKTAEQIGMGAMTVVMYNAAKDVMVRFAPTVAMGAYLEEEAQGVGAYLLSNTYSEAENMGGSYDLGEMVDDESMSMGQGNVYEY